MPTPLLNGLNTDLSVRLLDPVTVHTEQGSRFGSLDRHRYLNIGYQKLIRYITQFFPNLRSQAVKTYFRYAVGRTSESGFIEIESISEFYTLRLKPIGTEKWRKAKYIDPLDWIDILEESNTFFRPSLERERYLWTVANKSGIPGIEVLPATKFDYMYDYRPVLSIPEPDGDFDIDLSPDYFDILLAIALSMAYADLGDLSKATAYRAEAMDELKILNEKNLQEKQEDED